MWWQYKRFFFSFCLFPFFLFCWANRVRKLKVHYNRTQVSSIFQNMQLAITIWRHILNLWNGWKKWIRQCFWSSVRLVETALFLSRTPLVAVPSLPPQPVLYYRLKNSKYVFETTGKAAPELFFLHTIIHGRKVNARGKGFWNEKKSTCKIWTSFEGKNKLKSSHNMFCFYLLYM